MWTTIGSILGFIFLFSAVISIAKLWGEDRTKAEMRKYELERLAKEQERANKIIADVHSMSDDERRAWLRDRKRH